MFTVIDIRDPFLLWVAVELKAEADMSLTAQRLRIRFWGGGLRPPGLETRVLRVKAGETFTIKARKRDSFWAGERAPLDRVANKRPISRKWQTIMRM
jgi:hypothetical protein